MPPGELDERRDVECIDVYDDLGRWLGTKDRAAAHADGDWHRTFHCWVVARRPAGGTVVLQRRSTTKRAFPDLLDVSAAGHLTAGESPADGIRELHEELGIRAEPAALVPLGVRRVVDDTPEGRNRELVHVHLLRDDRPLEAYRPRPGEVDGLAELAIEQGLALLAGEADTVEVDEVGWVVGEPHRRRRRITRSALVPSLDGYWATALVMAERLLEGRRHLAI
ncbi:MAG: NUDIX domain-containing protein [Acidimicrobiales bacterium]|nr:NUDIX domain-containing protein [Acidimicrobiales bacterium]